MMPRVALLLGIVALLQVSSHAQKTPTEQLAQQRQQQQQQQRAQADSRRVVTRRLPVPCVVPDSYYPLRTCKVSTAASECARGWNAWTTFDQCCRPGENSAFPLGCTDFSREVSCWVPETFFPLQTCQPTNNLTRCSYNWGQWRTQTECCAPGRAFPNGCSKVEPCWVATSYGPERICGQTQDLDICSRGWGQWGSQQACCQKGNAFANGCGTGVGEEPVGTGDKVGMDEEAPFMEAA